MSLLRVVATVGCIGCLPRFGPSLAALAGLFLATALYLATGRQEVVLAAWALIFVAAAWSLPRAAAAGIPDREVVIDRFAGIWLAAAPALPLAGLLATEHSEIALAALATPLAIYLITLAGPLRRLSHSPRIVWRLGDDLLAGSIAALATVAAIVILISRLGGPA